MDESPATSTNDRYSAVFFRVYRSVDSSRAARLTPSWRATWPSVWVLDASLSRRGRMFHTRGTPVASSSRTTRRTRDRMDSRGMSATWVQTAVVECVRPRRPMVAENWPVRTRSCLVAVHLIWADTDRLSKCLRRQPVIAFAQTTARAGHQGIEISSTFFYWLPLRLCCAFGRAAAGFWRIAVRIENQRPMRSTVVGDVFVEPHHYQTRPTVRTPLIVVSGSHGVLRTAQSQQIRRLSSARRPQQCLTRASLPSRPISRRHLRSDSFIGGLSQSRKIAGPRTSG
jgi:hypothetical protein